MAARLGNVLYWTASGIAVLLVISGTLFLYAVHLDHIENVIFIAVCWAAPALIVWLFGLACRYVLAGPKAK